MVSNRFDDLIANFEHRIQARHRILENHCDVIASYRFHFFFRELQQVFAIEIMVPPDILPGERGLVALEQ